MQGNQEDHLYVADDAALVTVCRVLVTDHTSVVSVALVQVLVVAGIVVVVVVRQLYNIWYRQVVQFEMVQVPEETLSKVSSPSLIILIVNCHPASQDICCQNPYIVSITCLHKPDHKRKANY